MAGIITNINFTATHSSVSMVTLYPGGDWDALNTLEYSVLLTDDEGNSLPTNSDILWELENISEGSEPTDFACYYEDCGVFINEAGCPTTPAEITLDEDSRCTVSVSWDAMYLAGNYDSTGTTIIFRLTASSVVSPSVTTTTTFYLTPLPEDRGVETAFVLAYFWDASLPTPWNETGDFYTNRRGGESQYVAMEGMTLDQYGFSVSSDCLWTTTDADCTLTSPMGDSSYCTATIPGNSPSRTFTVELSSISYPLVEPDELTLTVHCSGSRPWLMPPVKRMKKRRR